MNNNTKAEKKIRYWRGFETWSGFDRIDKNIPKSEWERPAPEIKIAIPKKMGVNFSGENDVLTNETTTKILVFELVDKLETGVIYRLRGWE